MPGRPEDLHAVTDATFDYQGGIPPGHYDDIHAKRAGIQSKWHHLKFAPFLAALAEARDHLDIACSAGTLIGHARPDTRSVGVDLSIAQVREARRRHGRPGAAFVAGRGDVLPFADGTFDTVTAVEFIEHVDPATAAAVLSECRRVLAPGGRLFVSTPDYGGLWPLLEAVVNRVGEIDYSDQHVNRYRRGRLTREIEAAGFDGVRVHRYLFGAPFAAALGWGFADRVDALEPRWFTGALGFLLFAEARRP